MEKVKGRILLKQQISNLKEVGFEDIERTVNVMQAHIDGWIYFSKFDVIKMFKMVKILHLWDYMSA